MDIKRIAGDIVSRIKNDKDFSEKFKRDPAAAIETVIGVNLPNDQVNAMIAGVQAKLTSDKAGDLLGSFKKLF
ncbi:hypothetical protein OMP38_31540 [Cohnella ginsengisoli]|uniref:Uncharacterized protein n=1 Tax=Cohnella ginsengisoli TaxID=425004 RepID=A0A9X4QQQ4_9BACL|nr:hypothetical protein [Cohnella ginsengisoli]MDG0794856.1 hypothetical protein [Cohnella ginsengisoli]